MDHGTEPFHFEVNKISQEQTKTYTTATSQKYASGLFRIAVPVDYTTTSKPLRESIIGLGVQRERERGAWHHIARLFNKAHNRSNLQGQRQDRSSYRCKKW